MTEQEWFESRYPEQMLEFARDRVSDRKIRLFGCACCRHIWHLFPSEVCREAVKQAERFADGIIGEEVRREVARQAAEVYVRSAAAAEAVQQGTWDPLDCLAPEHARDEYEGTYEQAYQEGGRTPGDACEVWVSREAARAAYCTLLVEPENMISPCFLAASAVTFFCERDGWEAYCKRGDAEERATQRSLIDDIIGNPFRRTLIDLSWHNPTVLAIAQAAYEDRVLPEGTLNSVCLAVLADALEEAGCTNAEVLEHLPGPGSHVRGCWVVDRLLGRG